MARLDEPFDDSTVEPRDNFDPLPVGLYSAEIIESDVVPTKAGDGQRLTLTWKITGGPYDGRRVWDAINIKNPNEVAQKIGQQALAELKIAAGVREHLDDTDMLHGIPMQIRLKMSKPQSGYEQKNEVARYYSANETAGTVSSARTTGNGGAQATVTKPATTPAARLATGNRPWANRPTA